MKYNEQLKTKEWRVKREIILKRDKYTCQSCGSKKRPEVHHLYYVYGRMAWEYENESLVTLCRDCHESETNDRVKLKLLIDEMLRSGLFASEIINKLLSYKEYRVFRIKNELNTKL